MSLTGLDTPAVEEALKKILSERGGWFLISYETRDTVGILAEGVRGLHEMRDVAISYYSSVSDVKPLFGLTQFRRRKVLIRLVPEDTSRLFKARVQVHWFAVNARFPAFDTAYEITKPEELDDNSVGHHLDLHSSRSSTGSSKKPALHGIDEAAEDPTEITKMETSPRIDLVALVEEKPQKRAEDTTALIERSRNLTAAINNPVAAAPDITVPEAAKEGTVNSNLETPRPHKSYAMSVNHYTLDSDQSSLYDIAPRLSSQTMRPTTSSSTSDPYAHLFASKEKLGPRPSIGQRPASSRSESHRSVAALPSSVRSQRTLTTSLRPKSRDSTSSNYTTQPPPPVPATHTSLQRRPTSSGASIRSLPATLPKSNTMTPEKARLLKFRDMYRQKEASRARGVAIPPVPPLPQTDKPVTKSDPAAPKDAEVQEPSKPATPSDHTKSDSGVGMETTAQTDAEVEDTEGAVQAFGSSGAEPLSCEMNDIVDQDITFDVENKPLERLPREDSAMVKTLVDTPEMTATIASPMELYPEDLITPSAEIAAKEETSALEGETSNMELENDVTPVAANDSVPPIATSQQTPLQEQSCAPSDHMVGSAVAPATADQQTSDPLEENAEIHDDSDEDDWVNLRSNRRALVNPISGDDPVATETNSLVSEEEYDDDFMDELQSAIVEEAKTMPMPRSPGTAFFPRQSSGVYSELNLARKSTASLVHVNGLSPAKSSPPPMPLPLEPPGQWRAASRSPTGERISALPMAPREQGLTVVKKSKVGSGVAAKIADLQRNFSRGSLNGASTSPNNKHIEVVRKASTVSQRTAALGESVARATTPPWQVQMQRQKSGVSLASSIDPDHADKERPYFVPVVNARINRFESNPPERLVKPDGLSVTATIVRANGSTDPQVEHNSAELYDSPTLITQEQAEPNNLQSKSVRPATAHSSRPAPSIRRAVPASRATSAESASASKLAQVESYQPRPPSKAGSPRKSTDSAWRSFARKMTKSDNSKSPILPSQAVQPLSPPQTAASTPQLGSALPSPVLGRSLSNDSMSTLASTESVRGASASERKASRASRMMRRMSNSMSSIASITRLPIGSLSPPQSLRGNGSRDIIPTVHEDEAEPPPQHLPRPSPIDLGDLNVQFPDTLLWKRRFVSIDAYGFLVLKPVDGSVGRSFKNGGGFSSSRREAADLANTRKFHLTEFAEPFAPDLERMEMPNSIVLDLKDGRTLQCQCEGRTGQARMLNCLLESYHGWQ